MSSQCRGPPESLRGFLPYRASASLPGTMLNLINIEQDKYRSYSQGGDSIVKKRNKATEIWQQCYSWGAMGDQQQEHPHSCGGCESGKTSCRENLDAGWHRSSCLKRAQELARQEAGK